ncbi:MAG: NAD(+)/NADH kinase [Dehalococcoidia bacterium]|jgi:NAD+ kinase
MLYSSSVKRIGILYHPKIGKSEQFAADVEQFLKRKGVGCWVHSSWDEVGAKKHLDTATDLAVSVGGDGTILRVARIIFPLEIPIVGINFGNLGFMTELSAEDALDKLLSIIEGAGWTEERTMLQAVLKRTGNKYHALNDVVVGRGKFLRLVNIQVNINTEPFTTYRADAVIVATPTGSTGYSLAANGPILHPESRDLILKAVCPHLSMDKAVILAPASTVRLKVFTNHGAVVSMDGQVEEPLNTEDEIEVSLSPNVTKFIRLRPKSEFYSTLVSKLKGKSL